MAVVVAVFVLYAIGLYVAIGWLVPRRWHDLWIVREGLGFLWISAIIVGPLAVYLAFRGPTGPRRDADGD